MSDTENVTLFVPAAGAPGRAVPARAGSAIVGSDSGDGWLRVDFEDGGFAPAGYADLAERAWGRHVTSYPTVARALVPVDSVIPVGEFDPALGVCHVEDVAALSAWAPDALEQLTTTSGRAARTREFQAVLAARPELRASAAMRRQLARMMGVDD